MSSIFNDEDFKKASFCGHGCSRCVTVAHKGDTIAVRDSKDPAKNTLNFTQEEWQLFVAGVKNGEFDF